MADTRSNCRFGGNLRSAIPARRTCPGRRTGHAPGRFGLDSRNWERPACRICDEACIEGFAAENRFPTVEAQLHDSRPVIMINTFQLTTTTKLCLALSRSTQIHSDAPIAARLLLQGGAKRCNVVPGSMRRGSRLLSKNVASEIFKSRIRLPSVVGTGESERPGKGEEWAKSILQAPRGVRRQRAPKQPSGTWETLPESL